jgi:hypothetical protein
MEAGGVSAAVEVLVGIDVSVADPAELATASQSVARLQSFVDLAKVQIARRTRQLRDEGDTASTHVLEDEGRLSGKEAAANDERDRVCDQLPEFEDALTNGDCTAGHLDVLARHTKDLSDVERADLELVQDDLLRDAARDPIALFERKVKAIVAKIRQMHRPNSDVDELERQRAQSKVKRWTDRDTGMKHTLIALDPIRDASLWNVVDQHLARLRSQPGNDGRSFAELQVEALIEAIQPGDAPGVRVPEIVVHVDAASLCHGRHPDTLCETVDGQPVPVATVQRLCCEAILQAVIVDPDGTVDRICAEQRTANRQQRRMLAAMYRTCAHPHCDMPFSTCRIHHVEWFSLGGRTVLANMVPLCERHHHLVHEGGWHLHLDQRRVLTWSRPDGTDWATSSPDRIVRPDEATACTRPPPEPPPPGRAHRAPGSPPDASPVDPSMATGEQLTLT